MANHFGYSNYNQGSPQRPGYMPAAQNPLPPWNPPPDSRAIPQTVHRTNGHFLARPNKIPEHDYQDSGNERPYVMGASFEVAPSNAPFYVPRCTDLPPLPPPHLQRQEPSPPPFHAQAGYYQQDQYMYQPPRLRTPPSIHGPLPRKSVERSVIPPLQRLSPSPQHILPSSTAPLGPLFRSQSPPYLPRDQRDYYRRSSSREHERRSSHERRLPRNEPRPPHIARGHSRGRPHTGPWRTSPYPSSSLAAAVSSGHATGGGNATSARSTGSGGGNGYYGQNQGRKRRGTEEKGRRHGYGKGR